MCFAKYRCRRLIPSGSLKTSWCFRTSAVTMLATLDLDRARGY